MKTIDVNYKINNKNMNNKIDKFPHLNNIDPNIESILKMPLDSIDNQHLGTLRENLSIYSNHNNPEIASAALTVISKIDNIISLWKTKISWEIMSAANEDEYSLAA